MLLSSADTAPDRSSFLQVWPQCKASKASSLKVKAPCVEAVRLLELIFQGTAVYACMRRCFQCDFFQKHRAAS